MWSRHHLHSGAVLGLWTAATVQQQGANGVDWQFPVYGEVMTYHYMDTINLTWTSSFPNPLMYTFCQGTSGVNQIKVDSVNGYNSSALVQLNFETDDTSCWFDLKPNSTGGKGANSEKITFAKEVGSQVTIGIGSSSISTSGSWTSTTGAALSRPTTASTTSAASTEAADGSNSGAGAATRTNNMGSYTSTSLSSATETPSNSGDNDSSGGLAAGVQAGIGVGVGAMGVGLGATIVYLCMRKRRTDYDDDEKLGRPQASSPPPTSNCSSSRNSGSGRSRGWIEPDLPRGAIPPVVSRLDDPLPGLPPPSSIPGHTGSASQHGRSHDESVPAMNDTTAFYSRPEYYGYAQPLVPVIPEDIAKYAFPPPGLAIPRRHTLGPQELDAEALALRELSAVQYR